MSEPKYPRVFGFWVERLQRFTDDTLSNRSDAESESRSDETVVELVPLPEHEAIVAAAVAAERERCAGIAKRVADETGGPNRSYLDHFEQERIDTADMIERKIREVPT